MSYTRNILSTWLLKSLACDMLRITEGICELEIILFTKVKIISQLFFNKIKRVLNVIQRSQRCLRNLTFHRLQKTWDLAVFLILPLLASKVNNFFM